MACLVLVENPDGTVALQLASGGTPPAAIEWMLASAPGGFAMSVGAALTAASKTITCAATSEGYKCIAWGMNANPIPDGVIATAAAASGLTLMEALGASSAGEGVPLTVE